MLPVRPLIIRRSIGFGGCDSRLDHIYEGWNTSNRGSPRECLPQRISARRISAWKSAALSMGRLRSISTLWLRSISILYIYIYTHIHIYTHMYTSLPLSLSLYIYIYVYVYIYICIYAHIYTRSLFSPPSVAHARDTRPARIIYIYIYIHTYIHTYIHMSIILLYYIIS